MSDADTRATPLIRLSRFSPECPLWLKAELMHPSGSAFDRIAQPILERIPGPAIVAGAGSVCLAFCRAAALLERRLTVVCPQSTLPEHLELLSHHAARLVTTPAELGLVGAHDRAQQIADDEGGVVAFSIRVFAEATRIFSETLGEEIAYAFEQLKPVPELVVAPVAAGALLGGVGRALERSGFAAQLIGTVRPDTGSLQDGTVVLGELTEERIERVAVSDLDAFDARMALARSEGILVGMGSAAAVQVASKEKRPAIAIAVDAGDRYFSVDRRLRR